MAGILDRFRLDGRTALATGASAGLGEATAIALAEAGAEVVCYGDRRAPDAAAARIGRWAGRAAQVIRLASHRACEGAPLSHGPRA
jgi:NAD(P)-dependent dehydrogenase (short-subunit alcohol dehydrogenase family)